jgi:hypothetical protein
LEAGGVSVQLRDPSGTVEKHSGIIELDSERGKELGFTSDRFGGYLWESDERITISFIISHARGNFRNLAETILALGKEVAVQTPMPRMAQIVRRAGYIHTVEDDPQMGAVDVWVLKP